MVRRFAEVFAGYDAVVSPLGLLYRNGARQPRTADRSRATACVRAVGVPGGRALNVCPVYERTGGHAYGSVYPGPIGAVLTP